MTSIQVSSLCQLHRQFSYLVPPPVTYHFTVISNMAGDGLTVCRNIQNANYYFSAFSHYCSQHSLYTGLQRFQARVWVRPKSNLQSTVPHMTGCQVHGVYAGVSRCPSLQAYVPIVRRFQFSRKEKYKLSVLCGCVCLCV